MIERQKLSSPPAEKNGIGNDGKLPAARKKSMEKNGTKEYNKIRHLISKGEKA
jgi:hypothetical protein